MSKIIAVTGATGAQGGGVAQILLESKQWKVRAITRNPASDKAKALQAAGAEVVHADMEDEQSIVKAFEGAHAVFAVTDFWQFMFQGLDGDAAGQKEAIHAKNLARAASKISTLEHYLWSTLAPASKMTDGKFPCPHWDYKADVDDWIRAELPELAAKTTFMHWGFYSSNLVFLPGAKPIPTVPGMGPHILVFPCSPQTPLTVTGDMQNGGVIARQVLANPDKSKGKYISVATESISLEEITQTWAAVSGQRAAFIEISTEKAVEMYGAVGAELASQLKNNEVVHDWQSFRKSDFLKHADIGIKEGELIGNKGALERLKQFI